MIDTLLKELRKHQILSKCLFTVMILMIYILGQNIVLPSTNYENTHNASLFLTLASQMTGGNVANFSIFTLGLSPWMTALILFQVLAGIKAFGMDKMSPKVIQLLQGIFTLIVAILQAIVTIAGLKMVNGNLSTKLYVGLIMVAGAFLLTWLGSINAQHGIGGPTIIILGNILQMTIKTLIQAIGTAYHRMILANFVLIILGLIVFFVGFTMLNLAVENAEYRIPLTLLGLDKGYDDISYLPIKINPAGAMPIMFGMSILIIPQYVVQILYMNYTHNHTLAWLYQNIQINRALGAGIYSLTLFILAIVFAIVNVNTEKLAEGFQKSGDYFKGVRPGRETYKYLNHYVNTLALIGAVYMVVLAGLPLFIGVFNPNYIQLAMIPGNFMMIIGFSMTVLNQMKTLNIRGQYTAVLED